MRERIVTCLEREYPQRKRERERVAMEPERERENLRLHTDSIVRYPERRRISTDPERERTRTRKFEERERESKYPQLQRAKASCRQQAAKSPRCGYECRQGEWNVGPPTGPLVLSPFISGKGQELSEMPVWR